MADNQSEVQQAIRDELNRLRGHLAGFIEACGLPDRQERGAIATIKNLTYESEARLINLLND